MRHRWVPILALASSASCIGFCNPAPSGPPPEDTCTGGSADGVDTIEVGPNVDPFVPYKDGDEPNFVLGGQGFAMLPIRIRVGGPNPPACLAQRTVVLDSRGYESGIDNDPRAAYPDGRYRTTGSGDHALYVVLGYGPSTPLELSVTVGGKAVIRTLGGLPPDDGGAPDGAGSDGGASEKDASAPDAAPSVDAAPDQLARD